MVWGWVWFAGWGCVIRYARAVGATGPVPIWKRLSGITARDALLLCVDRVSVRGLPGGQPLPAAGESEFFQRGFF